MMDAEAISRLKKELPFKGEFITWAKLGKSMYFKTTKFLYKVCAKSKGGFRLQKMRAYAS